ncbi:MAG: hypothetical protein OJJ54_13070 [Pseudonocardia sp.]|nr:hypothetical protein [Pseudonocardia sp.]
MRSDIRPGGVFPDYAPPDHTGTVRSLGELQGDDPTILLLSRGHYCPKDFHGWDRRVSDLPSGQEAR